MTLTDTPTSSASRPKPPPQPAGDDAHRVPMSGLASALRLTQARTLPELVSRALDAALTLTGAIAGIGLGSDGTRWYAGDRSATEQLPVPLPLRAAGAEIPPDTTVLAAVVDTATLVLVTRRPWREQLPAVELFDLVVEHARATAERLHELTTLARRADSDPLTGLRHQRPFEVRLSTSQPGRTAVIAFDVDDFKKINDVYGHQAGDDALLALVAALRSALRGDDQLFRIGGDEFAVVVEVDGVAETRSITRRLLRAARAAGHTVSVGAAIQVPGETGRQTLIRADRALYEAKRAGRDTARFAA